jgi:hypothetical protein
MLSIEIKHIMLSVIRSSVIMPKAVYTKCHYTEGCYEKYS